MEFLCELYEANVARGRYFVHELTSEVNLRMMCDLIFERLKRTVPMTREPTRNPEKPGEQLN